MRRSAVRFATLTSEDSGFTLSFSQYSYVFVQKSSYKIWAQSVFDIKNIMHSFLKNISREKSLFCPFFIVFGAVSSIRHSFKNRLLACYYLSAQTTTQYRLPVKRSIRTQEVPLFKFTRKSFGSWSREKAHLISRLLRVLNKNNNNERVVWFLATSKASSTKNWANSTRAYTNARSRKVLFLSRNESNRFFPANFNSEIKLLARESSLLRATTIQFHCVSALIKSREK